MKKNISIKEENNKKITSINSIEQKKSIVNLLIVEEISEATISQNLNISVKETMDFLHKCYLAAEFQYQSNEILINLVNKYLDVDEKSLKDEIALNNLITLMGIDREYEYQK